MIDPLVTRDHDDAVGAASAYAGREVNHNATGASASASGEATCAARFSVPLGRRRPARASATTTTTVEGRQRRCFSTRRVNTPGGTGPSCRIPSRRAL